MSSRRLTARPGAQRNEELTPTQRSRPRDVDAPGPMALPMYEPPSCALNASATRALEELKISHDYSQYKKHVGLAIKNITNSVGDSNNQLFQRKQKIDKAAKRRERDGDEITTAEANAVTYVNGMQPKVKKVTDEAEKAVRDLIDCGDELAMKDEILNGMIENIAAAPPPHPALHRRRKHVIEEDDDDDGRGEEEEDVDDGAPVEEGSLISAVDLLKEAKTQYATAYGSKTMRSRYLLFPFQRITDWDC
jgi:hypothetical protein